MITDDRNKMSNTTGSHFNIFDILNSTRERAENHFIVIEPIYSMNLDVMTCLITLFAFGDIKNDTENALIS